jgi:hypothetical protein
MLKIPKIQTPPMSILPKILLTIFFFSPIFYMILVIILAFLFIEHDPSTHPKDVHKNVSHAVIVVSFIFILIQCIVIFILLTSPGELVSQIWFNASVILGIINFIIGNAFGFYILSIFKPSDDNLIVSKNIHVYNFAITTLIVLWIYPVIAGIIFTIMKFKFNDILKIIIIEPS